MKKIIPFLLISLSAFGFESKVDKSDVAELLLKRQVVSRDSGAEITIEFLLECLKKQSGVEYLLECGDLLFNTHVSIFESNECFKILVIEDGASVENRWIYSWCDNSSIIESSDMWPNISDETISELLIAATGNDKYSSKYIESVSHSSYRTIMDGQSTLKIVSGIPDESYGIELGIVYWTGNRFFFLPKTANKAL